MTILKTTNNNVRLQWFLLISVILGIPIFFLIGRGEYVIICIAVIFCTPLWSAIFYNGSVVEKENEIQVWVRYPFKKEAIKKYNIEFNQVIDSARMVGSKSGVKYWIYFRDKNGYQEVWLNQNVYGNLDDLIKKLPNKPK